MFPVSPFSLAMAIAVLVWGAAVLIGFKLELSIGKKLVRPAVSLFIASGILRIFGAPYTAFTIVDVAVLHLTVGVLLAYFWEHRPARRDQ